MAATTPLLLSSSDTKVEFKVEQIAAKRCNAAAVDDSPIMVADLPQKTQVTCNCGSSLHIRAASVSVQADEGAVGPPNPLGNNSH